MPPPDPFLNAQRLQAAERIRALARGPEMPHVLVDPPYGLEPAYRKSLIEEFREMYPAVAQWNQGNAPRPFEPRSRLNDPEWCERMIASFVPPALDVERVQAEQRTYRAPGLTQNPRPDAPFVLGTDIGPDPNDNGDVFPASDSTFNQVVGRIHRDTRELLRSTYLDISEPPLPETPLPSELSVTWDQNDVGTIQGSPVADPSRTLLYHNSRPTEEPRTIWQRIMEEPDAPA